MTNLRVFLGAHDATEAGACAKTVPRRTNEMPAASLFCGSPTREYSDELLVA